MLGQRTLHFMPHFHQVLFPQITICLIVYCCSVKLVLPLCSDVKETTCNAGDLGSIPAVSGVTKSWTRLSD